MSVLRFGAASDVAVLVSPERRIDGRAVLPNLSTKSLLHCDRRTRLVIVIIIIKNTCIYDTFRTGACVCVCVYTTT